MSVSTSVSEAKRMADEQQSSEMPFGVAVIFVLVGTGLLLASLLGWIAPAFWIAFAYRPATATVLETRPIERPVKGGTLYGLQARIGIAVDGHDSQRWVRLPRQTRTRDGPELDAVRRQVRVGQQIACFHDPLWPTSELVLERRKLEWSMIAGVLFPLVFLAAGASGLAVSWSRVFPRGAATEVAEVFHRLPRRFYLSLLDAAAIGALGALWFAKAPRGAALFGLLAAIAAVVVKLHRAARAGAVAWPSPERLAACGRAAGHPTPGKKPVSQHQTTRWEPSPRIAAGRGQRLAVRLRPATLSQYPAGAAGSAFFAVMVAGAVGVVLLGLAQNDVLGRPGSQRRVIVPVALIVAAVVAAVVSWRGTAHRVRGLALEISEHPLHPGRLYQVAVLHDDASLLGGVRLSLVRLEEAIQGEQRGGKNSDRSRAVRATAVLEPTTGTSGSPAGVRKGYLDVPAEAVPSLSLEHHWVEWQLAVRFPWSPFWTVSFPVTLEAPRANPRERPSAQPTKPAAAGEGIPGALWLDHGAILQPGAMLSGGYSVEAIEGRPLESVELSVLWETEGSGRRDRGVCHYEAHATLEGDERSLLGARSFQIRVPEGPPSYHGPTVRIHWRMRLRLRYTDGGELLHEVPFSLGDADA